MKMNRVIAVANERGFTVRVCPSIFGNRTHSPGKIVRWPTARLRSVKIRVDLLGLMFNK
jgi:hypothetical protein